MGLKVSSALRNAIRTRISLAFFLADQVTHASTDPDVEIAIAAGALLISCTTTLVRPRLLHTGR